MKAPHLQSAAIALVGLGLLANAAVAWFQPKPGTPLHPEPVRAQMRAETGPAIYYVARDTYFITASADGRSAYLWHYDFDPIRRNNKIEYVTEESVPR